MQPVRKVVRIRALRWRRPKRSPVRQTGHRSASLAIGCVQTRHGLSKIFIGRFSKYSRHFVHHYDLTSVVCLVTKGKILMQTYVKSLRCLLRSMMMNLRDEWNYRFEKRPYTEIDIKIMPRVNALNESGVFTTDAS
jgi:hypothetical protein